MFEMLQIVTNFVFLHIVGIIKEAKNSMLCSYCTSAYDIIIERPPSNIKCSWNSLFFEDIYFYIK